MKRKTSIIIGAAMLLIGTAIVATVLVSQGALGRLNEKMNIFNMVDGSLGTMRDMNVSMAKVKSNVDVLNSKLDLLGKTNSLLKDQLGVVGKLNGLMGQQKPLLNETNQSIGNLQSRLQETLGGVRQLDPVMTDLLAAMQGSLDLTSGVVNGTSQMVSLASSISGLFDQTIGCLARIAPLSAKAKAYMRGDLLSRLSDFLPKAAASVMVVVPGRKPAAATTNTPAQAQSPANTAVNGVEQVVNSTVKTVEKVNNQVLDPLLDPLNDLLK
jgi:hypothetical protein